MIGHPERTRLDSRFHGNDNIMCIGAKAHIITVRSEKFASNLFSHLTIIMKTIILCGGTGTRMKEETEFKPKPLVEVGGKPILWHIMKIYAHYGYNEFILALGYKGNMIKEYFLNWRSLLNDFSMSTKDNEITFHNND